MPSPEPSPPGGGHADRLREWFAALSRREPVREDDHNKGLAITTCVLISLVLWFTLSMRETYTVSIQMPTRVENLPDETALTALPPDTVQVEVQGEGFQLLRLRYDPSPIPINAEQNEIVLGELTPDLPKGVTVVSVSPRIFNLRKEERVARQVPVRFRGTITTPATHDLLQEPRLLPDSIVVSGARSIIDRLEYWPTVTTQIHGLKDSLQRGVALADTLHGLVRKSHIATRLTALARPFTEATREVPVFVEGGEATAQKFVTLEPDAVRVRYRVPLEQYEQSLEAPDFFATVSYEQIRSDTTGRIVPDVHLPADLVLHDVELITPPLRYYERLVQE